MHGGPPVSDRGAAGGPAAAPGAAGSRRPGWARGAVPAGPGPRRTRAGRRSRTWRRTRSSRSISRSSRLTVVEHGRVQLEQLGVGARPVSRSSSRARASCRPSSAPRSACTSSGAQPVRGVGLVADQLPERVDAGGHLAERLREPEEHVLGGLVVEPGGASCVASTSARNMPADRDRRVLERLQALTQPRPHVGRSDGADVEPAALLGLQQGGADPGDVVGDAARLAEPAPGGGASVAALARPARSARRPRAVQQVARSRRPARRWPGRRRRWRPCGGNSRFAAMPTAAPTSVSAIRCQAAALRAERADAEHEHAADRDLDEVRAQAQRLADRDARRG